MAATGTSLQEKVAIVTGASSGIGLATTQLFLERNASVFAIDKTTAPANLSENFSTFAFHQADLTCDRAVEIAVAKCIAKFGRIDILTVDYSMTNRDKKQASEMDGRVAIQLMMLMRAVMPAMKQQKEGNIVNVASRAGISGTTAGIAYTAAKHGLVGSTKNVAWRFRNDGIRCNAVLPGGVATNFASSVEMNSFDPAGFSAFFPTVQLHVSKDSDGVPIPIISADDVARGIVFLASNESRMINGALLPIDNAWSAT